MHATYPVVVRHHPGWFGALAGVVLGIVLTLGVLFATNRVDLTAMFAPEAVTIPTTTELLQEHWIREHQDMVRASEAAQLRAHFVREHQADFVVP
jgi:hypothetical protein